MIGHKSEGERIASEVHSTLCPEACDVPFGHIRLDTEHFVVHIPAGLEIGIAEDCSIVTEIIHFKTFGSRRHVFTEKSGPYRPSCGHSSESHKIYIESIENERQIHSGQIGDKHIHRIGRNFSVDIYILCAVAYMDSVHINHITVDPYPGFIHVPPFSIDHKTRFPDIQSVNS